jgi:hypothetical protein
VSTEEENHLRERVAMLMRDDALWEILHREIKEIVGFELNVPEDYVHFKGPKLIFSMPLSKALAHYEKDKKNE